MRLTAALGHKSVRHCQQHIDAAEFARWQIFDRYEPLSPWHDRRIWASIAAMYQQVHRAKGARAMTTKDWLPKQRAANVKRRIKSDDEMMAVLEQATREIAQ